ncbi:MAG: hypothetical protein II404_09430 [Prevotella sp.]|nr:hypothetical protein [Prevotella sp.]
MLDTLRRRAVFYAEWFTIPRIVARLCREDWSSEPFDKIVVTDDDLQWATVMYDAVIYWQDYFFGQMLQESWENANRIFVPRQRTSRNAELYSQLPDEFTNEIAVKVVGSSRKAIKTLLSRWVKASYIQRVKQGQYKKIMKVIV